VKKTIIHIIDSLHRGGAETLLANTISELSEYNNIIVLLYSGNVFQEELNNIEIIELNINSKWAFFQAVIKLRKIIAKYNPHIVHSHLFRSTLIGRISCPPSVRFIFSVHSLLGNELFENNKLYVLAENLTYTKRQTLISVSEQVRKNYSQFIKIKGLDYVLYNYVEPKFFSNVARKVNDQKALKLVAVGNLKEAKNYIYLINAFKFLKDKNISLDIYGDGPLKGDLQKLISDHNLNIKLMGSNNNICKILPDYDVYVISSLHEGFGIAPMEAMASGLPVMLSDIAVFREVVQDNAIYFDPYNVQDFINKMNMIEGGLINLDSIAELGYKRAKAVADKAVYIQALKKIYSSEG
jgi:glycosyltransferase involved in cell wall biosynthesis